MNSLPFLRGFLLLPLLGLCACASRPPAAAAPAEGTSQLIDGQLGAQGLVTDDRPYQAGPAERAQAQLMAGELAAAREQPLEAAQAFVEALAVIEDPRLAARATALALSAGDAALAERAAQIWLQQDASSMDAREVLLRLALRAGDPARQFELASAIVDGHAAGPAEGYRHLGLTLAQDNDPGKRGLLLLQALIRAAPERPGGDHALALLALRHGERDLAEGAARRALQSNPEDREAGLLLAGALVQRKALDEANSLVEQLAAKADNAADLRLGHVRLLLEAGEREAARERLERLVRRHPRFAPGIYALGVMQFNDGDLEAAARAFGKVLDDPDRGLDARFQLARIDERRGRLTDALDAYEQINRGPQGLEAAVRRAAVLAKLGRVEEARQGLERLRQQFPPLGPRLLLAEGEMLQEAGALDQALAHYEQALSGSSGQLREDLLYGRSLVHERRRDIAAAEADLRAILAAQPDDSRALNALGYMLTVHTARLEEARELIARAYAQEPEDAAIIDSLGWVQFKLGQVAEARRLLEQAFARAPDPEIAAHLGEVLWSQGEREAARAIWARGRALDPEHAVLRETLERLDPPLDRR
ncbi:MAG TPA: tetratricopeptide repeat protein [Nevskiaceae bacterium]|nr:tetratricopeptide repeat protein [Nevskiaceae bacterium]